MEKILWLLRVVDAENSEDLLTSIRLFADGSGRIIQSEKGDIADFDTLDEAEKLLEKMLLDFKK